MTAEIEIIPFMPEHLDGALRLSEQVNWPHRKEDWALMLDISEGVVAINDGQVVGTALTTLFGSDVATSNMIIVEQEMQGRGLGRQLMDEILSTAMGRESRLVATDIGLPLYTKLGFEVTGRVMQHQGNMGIVSTMDDRCEWDDAPDFDALCALDRAACGMDRHRLIQALIDAGKVAVIRERGTIIGFAILRDFGGRQAVGPVICDDIETAKSLLTFVFASRTEGFYACRYPRRVRPLSLADRHGIGACWKTCAHDVESTPDEPRRVCQNFCVG